MKPELLSESAIQQQLTALPDWQVEGTELVKEFRFASYLAGIEFVRRVAVLAEAMNHHPDLFVGWRKVAVRLTTHSAGGLTRLDFELAGQITSVEAAPVNLT
ncbi:MAG: 4a-hydroxytetrahydrobiopterin dehydratase [Prosthecobacter sp.]|uniref:4a-hydroxytetrahydrobiopterin dehydratase n=1 Tax=Prosthecobacter sp. TaxID=1965333 RepID=UPI0025D7C4B6|nr:4a-hydroxytetrahydrobiopterin dehydratase [Prosthecobacter sp.]MCF7787500.1 4a-hydroxytetrahydrobiopterin dehydratase [Prosthecobacter sp.]